MSESAAAELDVEVLAAPALRPLVSELRQETSKLRSHVARGEAEVAALRAQLEPNAKAIVMRNPLIGTSCPEMDVRFAGNGEPSANLYISNLPAPQVDLNTLRSACADLGLTVEEMKALPSTGSQLSSAMLRLISVEEATAALRAFCGQAPGKLGLQASQQLQSQRSLAGPADSTSQGVFSGAAQEALRSGRRRAESGFKGERPLHLVVNIMPGAVVRSKGRPEIINLLVYGPVFIADIKSRLVEAGLSWGPLMPRDAGPLIPIPEGHDLEGARLLFRGMPLKSEVTLQAQGVMDGSELRLLRARGAFQRDAHELRIRGGPELSTPRGLLMTTGMPPWQPRMGRTGP